MLLAALANRCVRQQQEREYAVFRDLRQPLICFVSDFSVNLCHRKHLITLTFSVSAEAEANYSKVLARCARGMNDTGAASLSPLESHLDWQEALDHFCVGRRVATDR